MFCLVGGIVVKNEDFGRLLRLRKEALDGFWEE